MGASPYTCRFRHVHFRDIQKSSSPAETTQGTVLQSLKRKPPQHGKTVPPAGKDDNPVLSGCSNHGHSDTCEPPLLPSERQASRAMLHHRHMLIKEDFRFLLHNLRRLKTLPTAAPGPAAIPPVGPGGGRALVHSAVSRQSEKCSSSYPGPGDGCAPERLIVRVPWLRSRSHVFCEALACLRSVGTC
jgi:hypothetical protein